MMSDNRDMRVNEMIKTLGFGAGALLGPAVLTGAILYASAPEAESPVEEQAMNEVFVHDEVSDSPKVYKDYGVVWTKL